jgi:hypothetical protein
MEANIIKCSHIRERWNKLTSTGEKLGHRGGNEENADAKPEIAVENQQEK